MKTLFLAAGAALALAAPAAAQDEPPFNPTPTDRYFECTGALPLQTVDVETFSWSEEAPATASTALERSIRATLALSSRAAARATAGSPAPDSTASERASSSSGFPAFAALSGPLEVAGIRSLSTDELLTVEQI